MAAANAVAFKDICREHGPCLSDILIDRPASTVFARGFANMANSDSSAARPDHARLTSSAYLLGSGGRAPASKTYEDADSGRDYGKIGNGRPGQDHGGEHGAHDPSEPLMGMEAVRLGSSFFVFGMLIGEFLGFNAWKIWSEPVCVLQPCNSVWWLLLQESKCFKKASTKRAT